MYPTAETEGEREYLDSNRERVTLGRAPHAHLNREMHIDQFVAGAQSALLFV